MSWICAYLHRHDNTVEWNNYDATEFRMMRQIRE